MGIKGLLELLDPITLKQHISSFRGQTVAIDIMSWIYKGCYRCAFQHNQNIQSNAFLYYIFEMLDLLSYYAIKPICVFDGRYVGKKDETIQKRKKLKQENKQKGLQFLKIGNEQQARKYLSRCIIIDDRIITLTMRAFHTKNIEFMVSPYESDSQIAKLIHLGIADFAITQDSDLIVYNVKVLLKLGQDGECEYIDVSKFKPKDVDTLYLKLFLNMVHINQVEAAILAGSDYNSSIRGIGIKKAVKHLSERKTLNGVIQHLRQRKPFCDNIPENYESIVLDSKLIFTFATVYNPFNRCLQFLFADRLSQIKPEEMSESDLKKIVGPFYAYNENIKNGIVNARTLQPRDIHVIDLKTVFSLNSNNLSIREIANQKRREFYLEQKKRREEQKALLPDQDQFFVQKKIRPKKIVVPPVQLSQEQKKKQSEQRKAQRLQRFSQFKSILNSFQLQESSESESSSLDIVQQPATQLNKLPASSLNRLSVNKLNKSETKKKIQKTAQKVQKENGWDDSMSCSESVEQCLQALNPCVNPWAKH